MWYEIEHEMQFFFDILFPKIPRYHVDNFQWGAIESDTSA